MNFSEVLPPGDSDLAQQITKDPYVLDFLGLNSDAKERHLKQALVDRIIDTLRELGEGPAFVGRQVHFDVNGDDFYVDLLFFHVEQLRYVVIELKTGKFNAECFQETVFSSSPPGSQGQVRMGTIRYEGLVVGVHDRTLTHLQIVIVNKLRKGEAFLMSWKDAVDVGAGRSSIWLHPYVLVHSKLSGGRVTPCLRIASGAPGSVGTVLSPRGQPGRPSPRREATGFSQQAVVDLALNLRRPLSPMRSLC